MAVLNENIELFKCLIRVSHFTKNPEDDNKFHKAYAFAVQSVAGKILTFHVMTDYGMLRSRVPISDIFMHEPNKDIPFHFKQLWDCFSINCTNIVYDYLKGARAKVVLKDKKELWGNYMMTFDWYDNSYSDEPTQYKCLHMIELDNGCYTLQPNNRIYWKHMSFVTKPFPKNPDFKVDNKSFRCEGTSDRWVIDGDDDSYYYDMREESDGR